MWNWKCAPQAKYLVKFVFKNYQRFDFSKYVVCGQERMGVRHKGNSWCPFLKETSNALTGIYIFLKFELYLKPILKNFGIILIKTCYSCIYLGLINTKISNKYKLNSLTNLPVLFYQLLTFWVKNVPSLFFLENKQNSNPYPLCKVGETQLWLIKTTCFTYLLLPP